MSFGDNLRKVRKERNISQEGLAELLNVSRQAISRWEQNNGYPEMEKMITLADVLNVSLDYLVSGDDNNKREEQQIAVPTGKIMIRSYDGKKLINCHKVLSFPVSNSIFKSKPDEPRYALFGVDNSSFWGDSKTLLGWYADEPDIQNEVEAITKALEEGCASYELKYAAKVKEGFLSVKFIDK